MDQINNGFQYLPMKLGGVVSEGKLKAVVLNGPEIRMLVKDGNFTKTLDPLEKDSWDSFVHDS